MVVRAASRTFAVVTTLVLGAAIAGLLALLHVAGFVDAGETAGVYIFIGILAACIAYAWSLAGQSVGFHADHLVVRRFGSARRVGFDEISALRGGADTPIAGLASPAFVTTRGDVVNVRGPWWLAKPAIDRIADDIATRLEARLCAGETVVFRETQRAIWWSRIGIGGALLQLLSFVATQRASDLLRPGSLLVVAMGITLVILSVLAGRVRGTRRVREISVTAEGIRADASGGDAHVASGGYRTADPSEARRIPWFSVRSITLGHEGLRIATDTEREALLFLPGVENLYALRRLGERLIDSPAREYPLRSANIRIAVEDEPALEGTEVEAVRAKGERGRT